MEQYLPFSFLTDPLCLRFVELMQESAREGVDLMQLLAERDDPERSLSGFAAQVLSAPSKTGNEGNTDDAVQSLILAFWRNELLRRRADLEIKAQTAPDEQGRDEMMAQASQLTTDLKRIQRWDTGRKVLALYLTSAG